MGYIYEELRSNPLRSKTDVQQALRQLIDPLKPYYSEGKALLQLTNHAPAYPLVTAQMEGFSRVLWGLVPLLAGNGESDMWDDVLTGIRNGTNPSHPEYWGEINDYDQRLVEMAVFGFALAAIPHKIWDPLTEQEQQHLFTWLNQVNAHPCYDCNWLFFPVLVNMGFRKRGLPYDANRLEQNLERMDAFYLGEGWYSDGVGGHADYYSPFAIHYYGLLYAHFMAEEDPERAIKYRERAAAFAEDFIYWFAKGGEALPYGRSLAYRFAQSAFWSALAYTGVQVSEPGVVKGLILRNLRWWFKQPIFHADKVLSVGYGYANLVMGENYNAPGSPYWAFKTFLILALDDSHPFWLEEERDFPQLDHLRVQQQGHLVIARTADHTHVAAFNTGHPSSNEHTHTAAKYEKFVYSTVFGFSVSRAEWGLSQGAFDSTLALSEHGDNQYRAKRRVVESAIHGNVLYSKWQPWSNVEVKSWIVAGLPIHVRIHHIRTERHLDAAEGGFALDISSESSVSNKGSSRSVATTSSAASGIWSVQGYLQGELVQPASNTNVLFGRSQIPTLQAELKPGSYWLVCLVGGGMSSSDWKAIVPDGLDSTLDTRLSTLGVELTTTEIIITASTGEIIKLDK